MSREATVGIRQSGVAKTQSRKIVSELEVGKKGAWKPHKELDVWQKSMALARRAYHCTRTWPVHERYGLASQMQRAAVSVACNIAEGAARGSAKEYVRFLRMSRASLSEVDTLSDLVRDLGYTLDPQMEPLMDDVGRMLTRLIQAILRTAASPGQTMPNRSANAPWSSPAGPEGGGHVR